MYTVQFYKNECSNFGNAFTKWIEHTRNKENFKNLVGAAARVTALALGIFCLIMTLHAAYVAAGVVTIGTYALLTLLSRDVYIVGRNMNGNPLVKWTVELPLIGPEKRWNFVHKLPLFPDSIGAQNFKAKTLSHYTQNTNILNQFVSVL